MEEKKYHLYVLYNTITGNPIYVGLSKSMKSRIEKHKVNKIFDGVFIIESFSDKKQGLSGERSIIKFLSLFKSDCIVNGLYDRFSNDFIPKLKFQNHINKIKDGKYN